MSQEPASTAFQQSLTYQSYLKINELLSLQQPKSAGDDGVGEHDEMLFIIIHQTYELWFKQLLHELTAVCAKLSAGDTFESLALLGRIRTILKICVAQVDILETMTPTQFLSFRERLDSASGFQSAQFRLVEAVLGRRSPSMLNQFDPQSAEHSRLSWLMSAPSLWDCCLRYFVHQGHAIPESTLNRDFAQAYLPNVAVEDALLAVHRHDPQAALVCERLVDIDEGLQEWRYRHMKMVERTIGSKPGTGGSSGVAYLTSTMNQSVFPELWSIRGRL
jgi:tryptophan 2,3-dioxygenase